MGGVVQGTTNERSVGPPLATRLVQQIAPAIVAAIGVIAMLAVVYFPGGEQHARRESAAVVIDSAAARADDRMAAFEQAMQGGDLPGARAAWREAYRALRRDPDWQRLADLGDRALELAGAPQLRQAATEDARRAYLGALVRARADASLEGVLRATEGFATIGDRDVVEEGLRIADSLAAQSPDPDARQQVVAVRARLERPQAIIGRFAPRAPTWDSGP